MSDSEGDNDSTALASSEEMEDDVTEQEKNSIREKLSTLSFEDLIKLKDEMGSKVYNATVFGIQHTRKNKSTTVKRANKNRPREISSKVRLNKLRQHAPIVTSTTQVIPTSKKNILRDPRFDPLCGSYDEKSFKSNYKFLQDVRINEKKQLEDTLQNTTNPEQKKKIKFLIQRIDNQIREQEKRDQERDRRNEEKKEIKEKLKRGEKPVFKKKSVQRLETLIEKYEELKKSNKLQKHIEKKTKKLSIKERKNSKIN